MRAPTAGRAAPPKPMIEPEPDQAIGDTGGVSARSLPTGAYVPRPEGEPPILIPVDALRSKSGDPEILATEVAASMPQDCVTLDLGKPEQPSYAWFLTADDFPRQQIVLATHDPQADPIGVPARWYDRRAFQKTKWVKVSCWVDPITLAVLDPQPTHWRPDPARQSLEVPVA